VLVSQKKLNAPEVYNYARYKWCLHDPQTIAAYQTDPNKWVVNNCDTLTTEEKAIIAANCEWGFEASRIQIIGTPHLDATDNHYIRVLDCCRLFAGLFLFLSADASLISISYISKSF